MIAQFFKQGDEVPQIPRQPVEAMDHELVDAARPDDAKQSLQGRPVKGRAGVPFVVKPFLDEDETQRTLGSNERPALVELDLAGGESTIKGLREYLILLSISETCKYKDVDTFVKTPTISC